MTPETRRDLEAYLAQRSAGRYETTLTYDAESRYVTVSGVSVAGGVRREVSHSTEFRGPADVRAVRSAIDHVVGVLSRP